MKRLVDNPLFLMAMSTVVGSSAAIAILAFDAPAMTLFYAYVFVLVLTGFLQNGTERRRR